MKEIKSKLNPSARGERLTSSALTALVIGVFIAVNAVVYALTVAFGLYLYSPSTDDMTISGSTDALFEKYDGEKVKIIFCRDKSTFESATMERDEVTVFQNTAAQFEQRYPDFIEIEYVNTYTKRNADGEFVDLTKYQDVNPTTNEVYPIYTTSVIIASETTGQHRVIYNVASSAFTYNASASPDSRSYSSYTGEELLASMVCWVLEPEHKTVYFTTYHGETSDIFFANMLSCAGYYVETIDLSKNEIPENADLVVISNPIKDFEASVEGSKVRAEIDRLATYLERGGNLYVALDPYVEKLPVLEGLIAEYGIALRETEIDGKVYRNIVKDSDNAVTTDNFTLIAEMAGNDTAGKIEGSYSEYTDGKIIVRECAALELSYGAEPILLTSRSSSTYVLGEKTDKEGSYCIGAVSKTGDGEGRIFVSPSVYLVANDALTTSGYANRDFLYSLLENAYGADIVPYGCAPIYVDSGALENLTMKTARGYTVLLLSIPMAIAVVGAVIVIKRKNR